MSQLTIYLDETSMKEVRMSAKRERISVSLWARRRLSEAVRHTWPPGYFDLFGAVRNGDLTRPQQGKPADDTPRSTL